MNRRERILAIVVGSLFALAAAFFLVRSVVLKPVLEVRKRISVAQEKLAKAQAERRAFFAAEESLQKTALRTFADSVDQASAKSGEILTRTILEARLAESEFTRTPVGPRKLRGASEIGWSVQGDGPLTNVVHLLFLLQNSPWLHRVEGLSFSSGDLPGEVRLRFRFLTLVLDPTPEVTRSELSSTNSLDSPERALLNGIVSRDLVRPYLRRPPPPPDRGSPKPGRNQPLQPPGPETYRIVSLSSWAGEPEVHVLDTSSQRSTRYRIGDELAGGTIALIDYRRLPSPTQPGLLSDSRVILRIGPDLYAVERGRSLADKRKLDPSEIPDLLTRNP